MSGVYDVGLSISAPKRVRREYAEVFAQRAARRTVLATRRALKLHMHVMVTSHVLMIRVIAHGAEPRVSGFVRLIKAKRHQAPRRSALTTPSQPIAFGAYVSGVPDYPSLLDAFTGQVGRSPAIVLWYRYWSERLFNAHDLTAVDSRGSVPMVTWEPWNPDHTGISLKGIAAGNYDSTINADARAAAAWGKPILARFAQEMNGHWYPWGLGVNGNRASDYVAAWRHIVDRFRAASAINVRWVWTPNEFDGGTPRFEQLYPGDAYVDWVGIDGYNFGSTSDGTWQSFAQIFSASYTAMLALTSKPMMISETGSVEQGGGKPAWITNALLTDVPKYFPRVRAVTWFDSRSAGLDWRIDSSASSLRAFRQASESPLYNMGRSSLLAITTNQSVRRSAT